MNRPAANDILLVGLMLAALSLRALTPAGYMPASWDSGLLFELCPDGLPVEIIRSLASGGHRHHHGGGENATSAPDRCPIGHMLSSAAPADEPLSLTLQPPAASFDATQSVSTMYARRIVYRSRAPPA